MARKKNNTKQDIQSTLNTLSLSEFLKVVNNYAEFNSVELNKVKSKLITDDLQNRLINEGINTDCPHCGSKNKISHGTRNNIKRFKCKDCNKIFTLFTNTILEKTKIHWDIWVQIVHMTLLDVSLERMRGKLEKDFGLEGLNIKSVFLWRHKIINALAQVPMPVLSGVIQIDETFFREDQKGSRKLETFVKGEERKPRYGVQPSKYGVMGNEFATVVCMVDLSGYTVSKVACLGKLTVENFTELFDEHIDEPLFICSDGNHIYKQYCDLKKIPLYIKPSNYLKTIQAAGIQNLNKNSPTYKKDFEKQQNIYRKLYYAKAIDYVYNMQLSYEEFVNIKKKNGLNLSRVNQLHAEFKRVLLKNMKGVSTKYLEDYIGFLTYVRNWSITHGYHPSSLEDAEKIFIDILKGKTTYKTQDLKNSKLNINKSSDKYMSLLKKNTEIGKQLTGNKYFKYDSEDHVISFDKKLFLEDLPKYKLDKLRRHYKISAKWVRSAVINELVKKPDIHEQILLLINEYKSENISEEDRKYLATQNYLGLI